MIVLIGYHDDQDLLRLQEAFTGSGWPALFFQLGLTSESYSVRWHSDSTPEIRVGMRSFALQALRDVQCIVSKWWRMDDYPLVRCSVGTPEEDAFAEREWRALISSVLRSWRSSFRGLWIGQLIDSGNPDLKLYYLEKASRFGLNVPPFCASTELERPLPGVPAVGKAINKNEMIDPDRYFRTSRLGSSTLDELQGRRAECPSLLQVLVGRCREQRIIVCGEEMVVVDLASGESEVDIRFVRDLSISISNGKDVPAERILSFCKAVGLTFCTLDFVVDQSHALWLVDVTPNGSWFWHEGEGREITHAVATCIKRQNSRKGGLRDGTVER